MAKKQVFIVIVFPLFIVSCSTNRLNIEKPKESYIEPSIEARMSTIGMSLDIDNLKLFVSQLEF